jgi:hypothetical protein
VVQISDERPSDWIDDVDPHIEYSTPSLHNRLGAGREVRGGEEVVRYLMSPVSGGTVAVRESSQERV